MKRVTGLSTAAIRRVQTPRTPQAVSRNVRNAVYSLAEYLAQPAAMLAAAPFLVHRLGLQQYGLWMLVSAILGGAGILSTGFGDATLKYAAAYRGRSDFGGVERTIRATLAINLILGLLLGILVYVAAPRLAYAVKVESHFQIPATHAFQISAAVLICRSIESVFISALRAFEHYGPAVKLSIFLRLGVVGSAVILAAQGRGVVEIMAATLFWSVVVVILQAAAARRVAGPFKPIPSLAAINEVFAFGSFSWLQALAGVAFSYADRFLVGILLGTGPVAIYVLCVQAAQPIHGVCAAVFNFLLPHLSSRQEAGELDASRQVCRWAVCANLVTAGALALPLIIGGRIVLSIWMGTQFASQARGSLAVLAVAFALLALNVVPHYSLLAMGDVRYVSGINVLGGALSLCASVLLIPHMGIVGAGLGRLLYGCVTIVLWRRVRRMWPQPIPVCDEVVPLSAE